MTEVWKVVEGFENYQVSNTGKVKSKNGIIKNCKNKYGYYQIMLWKDGKAYSKRLHRLVLHAFEPKENDDKLQVNHKDLNKENNNLSNLEWCTPKQNTQHLHKNANLDYYNSIACYDNLGNSYKSFREAARKTGVAPNTVKNDVLGKTKNNAKSRTIFFSKEKPQN